MSPALDVTYLVDDYRLGAIHRPAAVIRVAGGKAFNAARAATILGAPVTAVGLLGGGIGAVVKSAAETAGLTVVEVSTDAETRSCVSVASAASGHLTEVYEHPAAVTGPEWTAALGETAAALQERPGWLLVSGGMPASLGTAALGRSALGDVLEVAHKAGVMVAIDSHGDALGALLEAAPPSLLKINRSDAAEVLSLPVDSPLLELATALHRRTSGMVVITDGVGGTIGIDAGGSAVHVSLPGVTGLYPVGSGDSFLGALVGALDAGDPFESGLRVGTAAATANALVPGAAVFTRSAVESLLPQVQVIPIARRSVDTAG